MKKQKNNHVKLLTVKLGKTTKETKMDKNADFNFENLTTRTMKPPPPVKRNKPPTRFTPAEDQLLVEACRHNAPNGKCTKDFLEALAKHLNIKFHEKKKQRTGESLWWHIHREQKKGNTYFAGIEISGSTPDKNKSNGSKGASQVIKSALKTTKLSSVINKINILPPTTKTNNKTSGGKNNYEIIIRDPLTGQTERIQTRKFETLEEVMFALT